jgi:tetratricopeptide (TPR) repeat protein
LTDPAQRAAAALRERRWQDARSALDAAIAVRPGVAELYFHRARALHGLGETAAALADLDRAVGLDCSHARALCLRATLGVRADGESLADLDRAIALAPELASAYLVRAQLRARLGRSADAAADLDRAVALRPDNASARRARARHLLDRGGDAAREDVERALSDLDVLLAAGEEPALRYQRARALRMLGRSREAAEALGRVVDSTSPLDALHRAARSARRRLWDSGAAEPPEGLAPPVGAAARHGPSTPAPVSAARRDETPPADWAHGEANAARLGALPAELRVPDRAGARALRRRSVRRAADRLSAFGFAHRGELVAVPRGDGPPGREALMVLTPADGRIAAWIREPVARRGALPFGRSGLQAGVPAVELITTLDDGGFVVTSAADGPPPREIPPGHDCRYLVPGTAIDVLVQRHTAAVDERLRCSAGVDAVLAHTLDEAVQHYERRRLAVLRHLVEIGLAGGAGLRRLFGPRYATVAPALRGRATARGPVPDGAVEESAGAPDLDEDAAIEDALAGLLRIMPADWQDGLRPGRDDAEIGALMDVLGAWRAPVALARLYAYRDGQEPGQESFMPGLRLLPLDEAVSGALDLEEQSGPPLLPVLRGTAGTVYAVLSRGRGGSSILYRQYPGEPRLSPAFDSPARLVATVQRCHAAGAFYAEAGQWREAAHAADSIRRCNPRAAAGSGTDGGALLLWDPATWPEDWLARAGLLPAELRPRGATVSAAELLAWTFGQWPEPAVVRGRVEAPARLGSGARFVLNDTVGRIQVVCPAPYHLFVRAGAVVEAHLRRPPTGGSRAAHFEAQRVVALRGPAPAR